jgi:tRNA pseudouridine13 synthase
VVEEEAQVPVSAAGDHAVYRLTKSSWDTFDLLALLARRLGVAPEAVSVGGMKDRHGRTTQLFAVRGLARPPRGLADRNFTAELAGFTTGPLTARSVRGNRFSVVLRDMSPAEVGAAEANLASLRSFGVPNYYDEQRFGSARHGGGFMGKAIFLGRREEALKLYFLPSKHDDQKTRRLKKCVTAAWGRWGECLPLAFGQYGRVLSYLAGHPRAFHKALALIERRFLVFVLNAYQSYLFNEILRRRLAGLAEERGFPTASVPYAFGSFLFPCSYPPPLFEELARATLPVPGHDSRIAEPAVRAVVDQVLAAEEITLEDLRVRQMQKLSAHGVERRALVLPEDLTDPQVSADDLYPGRRKMAIRFFLPRGSYATLVIKRLACRT